MTPYNWRLMSAASAALTMRPTAEALISAHVDAERSRGVVFAPWSPEGHALFRGRPEDLDALYLQRIGQRALA